MFIFDPLNMNKIIIPFIKKINIPSRLNVTYFYLQFSKHFMLQILKYQKGSQCQKADKLTTNMNWSENC